jgi:hypothetical protein
VTTPASGFGGDDRELLSLGSAGLSRVPFLGYRLRESHLDTAETDPYIHAPQRWIAETKFQAVIDVLTFNRYQPFKRLLNQDSTSEIVTSMPPEVVTSWPDDARRFGWFSHEPSGLVAFLRGNDFQALVDDSGVRICAASTVATALRLLFDDFSQEIRARTVQARPTVLREALAVFRPEIRQRYIPRAEEYVADANSEVSAANRKRLAEIAARRRPQVIPPPATDPPAASGGPGDAN